MIVKINDIVYNVDDEIKVNKVHSEGIEYLTFYLENDNRLEIEVHDPVEVDNKKYVFLDYEWTLHNDNSYSYTINVANPAIKLKGITLPNRSYTYPLTGNPITLGDYVNRLIEIYYPSLTVDTYFSNWLQTKNMREYIWNSPTLFDVLNDLLKPYERVITMSDYDELNFINLVGVGNSIKDLEISEINGKTNYDNYASDFNVAIKSGLGGTPIVESVKFETIGQPILDDRNFIGRTKYPIDSLLEFYIVMNGVRFNFINFILEKSQYETLLPSNENGYVTTGAYKRRYVYWEKGNNVIGGFDYNDNSWFPIGSERYTYDNITGGNGNPKNDYLEVVYIPQFENVEIGVTKGGPNKTIANSQSGGLGLVSEIGKQNDRILNRSSQEVLIINGSGTPPELLDYYNEYTIFNVDITRNTVADEWVAIAQKNFTNVILETAVSNQSRYVENINETNAIIMNHINYFNYEFTPDFNDETDVWITWVGWVYSKNQAAIPTSFVSLYTTPVSEQFCLIPQNFAFGNGVGFHFRMMDNFAAGVSSTKDATRVTQQYVGYASGVNNSMEKFGLLTFSGLISGIDNVFKMPIPSSYGSFVTQTSEIPEIKRYKDNREILAETFVFSMLSNETVIFYPQFFENTSFYELGSARDTKLKLYINKSSILRYNKVESYRGEYIGTYDDDLSAYEFNGKYLELKIIDNEMTGWCLVDNETDKMVLAVNGNFTKLYGRRI